MLVDPGHDLLGRQPRAFLLAQLLQARDDLGGSHGVTSPIGSESPRGRSGTPRFTESSYLNNFSLTVHPCRCTGVQAARILENGGVTDTHLPVDASSTAGWRTGSGAWWVRLGPPSVVQLRNIRIEPDTVGEFSAGVQAAIMAGLTPR